MTRKDFQRLTGALADVRPDRGLAGAFAQWNITVDVIADALDVDRAEFIDAVGGFVSVAS